MGITFKPLQHLGVFFLSPLEALDICQVSARVRCYLCGFKEGRGTSGAVFPFNQTCLEDMNSVP